MITAIDANILLDILGNDPAFSEESMELIKKQHLSGSLIISPLVYAELLVFFLLKHEQQTAMAKLDEFVKDLDISVVDFTREDYIIATEAWKKFFRVKQVACPKCGSQNAFQCKKCNASVLWRNHLITDFLVGAHAQNHAEAFLTRDRGYYQKYFNVRIIPSHRKQKSHSFPLAHEKKP